MNIALQLYKANPHKNVCIGTMPLGRNRTYLTRQDIDPRIVRCYIIFEKYSGDATTRVWTSQPGPLPSGEAYQPAEIRLAIVRHCTTNLKLFRRPDTLKNHEELRIRDKWQKLGKWRKTRCSNRHMMMLQCSFCHSRNHGQV